MDELPEFVRVFRSHGPSVRAVEWLLERDDAQAVEDIRAGLDSSATLVHNNRIRLLLFGVNHVRGK